MAVPVGGLMQFRLPSRNGRNGLGVIKMTGFAFSLGILSWPHGRVGGRAGNRRLLPDGGARGLRRLLSRRERPVGALVPRPCRGDDGEQPARAAPASLDGVLLAPALPWVRRPQVTLERALLADELAGAVKRRVLGLGLGLVSAASYMHMYMLVSDEA